jgi:glutamate synthase domain-containing protein 3
MVCVYFSFSKCNQETVELLPLDNVDDIAYVKELLIEFQKKTGSLIAEELLKTWPQPVGRFIKVQNLFCIHLTYFFLAKILKKNNNNNNLL